MVETKIVSKYLIIDIILLSENTEGLAYDFQNPVVWIFFFFLLFLQKRLILVYEGLNDFQIVFHYLQNVMNIFPH